MPLTTLADVTTLAGVAAFIIGYINLIIGILVSLALVIFLYWGYRYIFKAGDSHGGSNKERDKLLWGLVSLFVIVSIWGILRVMCLTFVGYADCRLTTGNVPRTPATIHTSTL